MFYLMKRPFDIGTFPKNHKRTVYHDLDFRKTRFYCAIKTKTPLTEKEIYDFELKTMTDEDFNSKEWL